MSLLRVIRSIIVLIILRLGLHQYLLKLRGFSICTNRRYWRKRDFDILPKEGEIDIVYLWVDTNDPKYISSRLFWMNQYGYQNERFRIWTPSRNNDELRHALRSLSMNAPWIRNVYIITNNQIPSWLDLSDSRIRIVDAQSIYDDPEPRFNNHSIKVKMHEIQGLSEWFLQSDDDFFFSAPVPLDIFFDRKGKTQKLYLSSTMRFNTSEYGLPVQAKILEDTFKLRHCSLYMFWCAHLPRLFKKSVIKEMWLRWPSEFNITASHKFRESSDIEIDSFYAYYTANTYKAKIIDEMKVGMFVFISKSENGRKSIEEIKELIDKKPYFANLQDNVDKESWLIGQPMERSLWKLTYGKFYHSMFPDPSPFEKKQL